jgi:hypothetical protein
MYRVLRGHDEVRERRRQATHPAAKKPELLAEGPNQCWSWDIVRVYVDWMYDPQLDRSHVTPSTARVLRHRMNASASLIYVSSPSSPDSKWMPWELGYFDGFRPGKVAILPVVRSSDSEFREIEFVGLYPKIERDAFGHPNITSAGTTQSLSQFRA